MPSRSDARRHAKRAQRYQLPLVLDAARPEPTERDLRKAWRCSAFPDLNIGFDEVMATDCLARCLRLFAIARMARRNAKGPRA